VLYQIVAFPMTLSDLRRSFQWPIYLSCVRSWSAIC